MRRHCDFPLPAPFNDDARGDAGLPPEWYEPVGTGQVTRKEWLGMKAEIGEGGREEGGT